MNLLEAAKNLLEVLDTITPDEFRLVGKREAKEALRKTVQETPSPRIMIEVEGGLIQTVCSDQAIQYCLIDMDVDGIPDERKMTIKNNDGVTVEIYRYRTPIKGTEVDPRTVKYYFNQVLGKGGDEDDDEY